MRVKSNVASRKRRKRVMARAKGFSHGRRRYRIAMETIRRADAFAYRDRRNRKREFRKLWIQRINAAARMSGLNYSRFMRGLTLGGVQLDRKQLAEIAVNDPNGFTELVAVAQKSLAG